MEESDQRRAQEFEGSVSSSDLVAFELAIKRHSRSPCTASVLAMRTLVSVFQAVEKQ